MWARIREDMIWENRTVKLLGITIDNELKFDENLTNICIKVSKKFTVLKRMKKYLDFSKLRLLFIVLFESQFKYCPLTWMFYSRKTNNRINELHERALRLPCNDYECTFEDFLTKDGSFIILYYLLGVLAIGYSEGGCSGIAGERACGSVISIELHSNSVGITLPHGCSPVSLLGLSGSLFGENTSGRLLLNEALLMHHFFCETANHVLV